MLPFIDPGGVRRQGLASRFRLDNAGRPGRLRHRERRARRAARSRVDALPRRCDGPGGCARRRGRRAGRVRHPARRPARLGRVGARLRAAAWRRCSSGLPSEGSFGDALRLRAANACVLLVHRTHRLTCMLINPVPPAREPTARDADTTPLLLPATSMLPPCVSRGKRFFRGSKPSVSLDCQSAGAFKLDVQPLFPRIAISGQGPVVRPCSRRAPSLTESRRFLRVSSLISIRESCCRFFRPKTRKSTVRGRCGRGSRVRGRQGILATWGFARRNWAEGSITALFASSTCPVSLI